MNSGTNNRANAAFDETPTIESLKEEFQCVICCDLMVFPTTLNCGHSFCRGCLAQWFDISKKAECPNCRQDFIELPKVNINLQATIEKVFPKTYANKVETVVQNLSTNAAIANFEKILKERHKEDKLTQLSGGCLFGTGLALVVVACIYLAMIWGSSDSDLLVRKPLTKWTAADVSSWLQDLGLEDYHIHFQEQRVNGQMLAQIQPEDLDSFLGIHNELHKRTFLQALNYTVKYGVKLPSNLWEYKAVYPGYTTFLLYSMGHTPRLALVYMYMYDEDGLQFFIQQSGQCKNTCSNWELAIFVLAIMLFPQFVCAQFVWSLLHLHWWTSIFLLFQCICKGSIDAISLYRSISNFSLWMPVESFGATVLMAVMYYVIGCLWWLIPSLFKDALFYAEIYFSPYFYLRELKRRCE